MSDGYSQTLPSSVIIVHETMIDDSVREHPKLNPFTADQHLISLYNITPKSHGKVRRIKQIIPTEKALDC